MGLLDIFKRTPKVQMVPLATRSYLFSSQAAANNFVAAAQGSRRTPADDPMIFLQLTSYAESFGGSLIHARTTHRRETLTYGYLETIHAQDRDYLVTRDTTAMMFIEEAMRVVWNGIPVSYVPEIDSYFADQIGHGLITALTAAYQEYREQGGALIYLEATGNPRDRLSRGDRPIRWTCIPADDIVNIQDGPNGYILADPRNKDPLLDHGIEYISFYQSVTDRTRGTPLEVHGSRIIPVCLHERTKWWRTRRIPLNNLHDTLWDLRDLIWSRVRQHFQGDPIVVETDLSADAQKVLAFEAMTQEERSALGSDMENAIKDYNAGVKTTFAPVMGFKMRRLGEGKLPDPQQDLMALSSRLAHAGPYPVKMVLASTKGNTDVGDQDLLIFQGNIQNIRNTWGYQHLARILLMGRVMGVSGLRMQDAHELPPTRELEWPLVRPLSPRDAAFTEKTDVVILRESWEMGKQPPIRIRRKFTPDPSLPLAPWLAAKGRGPDGKNLDAQSAASQLEGGPDEDTPPGSPAPSPPSPPMPALPIPTEQAIEAVAESLDSRIEEKIQEALEESGIQTKT